MRDTLTLLVCLAIGGCAMDLPSGVLLDRPRALGARVEIPEDPRRASPRPGESAELRWWVQSPEPTRWSAALVACVASPVGSGLSGCAGDPFAILTAEPTPDSLPALEFTTPPPEALAGSGALLFAGILCADGLPILGGEGDLPAECEGEDAFGELVAFTIPVAVDTPENRHPALRTRPFFIDDAPWDPHDEPPPTQCANLPSSPSLPHVAWLDPEPEGDGEPEVSRIRVEIDDADREPYRERIFGIDDEPMFVDRREDLTLSNVATAGRLRRQQTVIFDEASADVSVGFAHPASEEIPSDGLTIRFFFVLRDGRGGADWTTRTLCLLP